MSEFSAQTSGIDDVSDDASQNPGVDVSLDDGTADVPDVDADDDEGSNEISGSAVRAAAVSQLRQAGRPHGWLLFLNHACGDPPL